MAEWGIFTSEGLLEGDFWDEASAEAELDEYVRNGDLCAGDGDVRAVCKCRAGEAGYCADCGDEDDA